MNHSRTSSLLTLVALGLAGTATTASAQYCDATSGYLACNNLYEYISNVTVGSFSNSSGCEQTAYEDYTGQTSGVQVGVPMPISVSIGAAYAADQLKVWIDWDQNQTFDAAEEVVMSPSPIGTSTLITGTILPPGNAVLGNTRMRVRLTYNSVPNPCGASGAYGNIEDYTINVGSPTSTTNPFGNGGASPSVVQITGSSLLTVAVTPGANPTSTGLSVTGNLSAINGSASQTFYDNGTNGDVTPGDSVFSFQATINEPASAGAISIPYTITDAQARTGSGSINMTLTAAPVGACCSGSTCNISTAYNCGASGGSYSGNGSNCGIPSYTITAGTAALESIAGTGTLAGAVSACDDCLENIALPFSFSFFDNSYNDVWLSSNGNLQFGAAASNVWTNDAIPTAAVPNNGVYPLWDDYNPLTQGDVYYQEQGTAPNRTFTVEWNNVTQYTAAGAYPITSETFQVILHETTNSIEYRYGTISADNTSGVAQGLGQGAGGSDRTVGVENADGSNAYVYLGTSVTSNSSVNVAFIAGQTPCTSGPECSTGDFDGDGDTATDADIEAFFACIAGNCCATCWHLGADFNGDGDTATDRDIESFFSVIAGGTCLY